MTFFFVWFAPKMLVGLSNFFLVKLHVYCFILWGPRCGSFFLPVCLARGSKCRDLYIFLEDGG